MVEPAVPAPRRSPEHAHPHWLVCVDGGPASWHALEHVVVSDPAGPASVDLVATVTASAGPTRSGGRRPATGERTGPTALSWRAAAARVCAARRVLQRLDPALRVGVSLVSSTCTAEVWGDTVGDADLAVVSWSGTDLDLGRGLGRSAARLIRTSLVPVLVLPVRAPRDAPGPVVLLRDDRGGDASMRLAIAEAGRRDAALQLEAVGQDEDTSDVTRRTGRAALLVVPSRRRSPDRVARLLAAARCPVLLVPEPSGPPPGQRPDPAVVDLRVPRTARGGRLLLAGARPRSGGEHHPLVLPWHHDDPAQLLVDPAT